MKKMKTNRALACLTAAVLSVASLPVLSAAAVDETLLGDVDGDGMITGHDTAMVSRSLNDTDYTLTAEQAALADMDGDGTVTQADLEAIHQQETYALGAVLGDNGSAASVDVNDAYAILVLSSIQSVGGNIEVSDEAAFAKSLDFTSADISADASTKITMNTVQYNLADVDLNGRVEMTDAYLTLVASSYGYLGTSLYAVEGRYEYLPESYRQ